MSSIGCPDCATSNYDEEYENAKQRAKQVAINNGEPQAIYRENGEYKFTSARWAIENGIPVTCFISSYS